MIEKNERKKRVLRNISNLIDTYLLPKIKSLNLTFEESTFSLSLTSANMDFIQNVAQVLNCDDEEVYEIKNEKIETDALLLMKYCSKILNKYAEELSF